MKYFLLAIVMIAAVQLYAQDQAYVTVNGTQITIGNRSVERVIEASAHSVSGSRIVNKISGSVYQVGSSEFALEVVFSAMGPAYSAKQNGENDVILTARDFQYRGSTIADLPSHGKELKLSYAFTNGVAAITANVYYDVTPGSPSLRKWIELVDSAAGIHFLDRIYLESLTFRDAAFSHGQFGQPVFKNDIFLGVEYPTAENRIDSGRVMIGYVVGEKLTTSVYKSHSSILGAASSAATLERTFLDYIEGIRAEPTRPFLLYNTWYDLRDPSLAENPQSIMNEDNLFRRISEFKQNLDSHRLKLDAFVLDDGWDNLHSVWRVDSTRFPHGFSRIQGALANAHIPFGLWASPWGGYESRAQRTLWAAANGYETTSDFLCFAGTKYKAAMRDAMVEYARDLDVSYFKWDGFPLACNSLDHGHLPGIYSREAFVSTYIDMMHAVRQVHPHIFLNITSGTWLSPWWLKYADCIWMQGEDYAYAENVPCLTERDKAITYRDGVLWDDYRKQDLVFPMSSLMTHGIIKGQLNLLGGKNESAESFCNEVMMYFGRGIMMWELYVSPNVLSENDWNALASAARWAEANRDVLRTTKMILGNPVKREPYGYLHMTKRKGILLLRNPGVEGQDVSIALTPALGDFDSSAQYVMKIIYPYSMILPKPVSVGRDLVVHLDAYQVLAAELIPSSAVDKNLPVNTRYSITQGRLTDYGTPKPDSMAARISCRADKGLVTKGTSVQSQAEITIPREYTGARFGLLLDPGTGQRDRLRPQFEATVNGQSQQLTIEQENGKWFWVLANLQTGKNTVRFTVSFDSETHGKLSLWVFADHLLSVKGTTMVSESLDEPLPAVPYPANIEKLTVPITVYTY